MFVFSTVIIACEVIFLHMLFITTNYLKATFIIGIAMLGISFGSFIGFYLLKFNNFIVMLISSIVFFISIIFSYYNIIAIGFIKYPFFLILPFISGSIIVSTIFAKEHSNTGYFLNLIGSSLGSILPIFLVREWKSEGSLIIIMIISLVFILFLFLKNKNIIVKIIGSILSIFLIMVLIIFFNNNNKIPKKISITQMEENILPLLYLPKWLSSENYDYIIEKLSSNEKEDFKNLYEYDEYFSKYRRKNNIDIKKLKNLSQTISKINFRNNDINFLKRVFIKNEKNSTYDLNGDKYDKKRAKYLLQDIYFEDYNYYNKISIFEFIKNFVFKKSGMIDLNFNIIPHRELSKLLKIYSPDRNRIILSEDTLFGRVELLGDDSYMNMAIDGVILDGIDSYNGAYFDSRIPNTIENANVFIVGLSADGIVKSAKKLPNVKKVSGIEINPVIIKIMQEGQFAKFANYPYKDVEVYYGEGKSFLKSTKEIYDYISLMNIHMEHGPNCTLSPEYFHTIEGTDLLLNKLTDRGMIVYEEILFNYRSTYAFYKFLNTIVVTLEKRGVKNPFEHIYVFEWDFWGSANVFRTVCLKRNPFTDQELKKLDDFVSTCEKWYPSIKVDFHPKKRYGNILEDIVINKKYDYYAFPTYIDGWTFTKEILEKTDNDIDFKLLKTFYNYSKTSGYYSLISLNDKDKDRLATIFKKINYPFELDLSPTTDNKPFPFNIYKNKKEVTDILKIVLIMTLFLLIPVILVLISNIKRYKIAQFIHILFFAITGFGYMIIEIVLMQKYQQFIGNPVYSFMITLGGLLFFSGIGSFVSKFLPKKVIYILVIFIPIIIILKMLFLDSIFNAFAQFSFNAKLVLSILLLFLLTFLIGIPFPTALEKVKNQTTKEFGPLMFGISGIFSTLGSTTSILFTVTNGFKFSFMIGFTCYFIGILLFYLIMFLARKV
ncbi:MAG TPA: hypothetical protein PLE45_03095 [Spirochaetota bacterium]|nr:hypothetical protein [Spirochaetota bacterium]HOL56228.1 hypothetical protein [Spirochaetota bacterium]HPP03799.1 hypothetical protein [Spirochaetota bacterium]